MEECQGKILQAEPEAKAMEEGCLLACSPWFAQPAFLSIRRPPAQEWHYPQRLVPPTDMPTGQQIPFSWISLVCSTINQEYRALCLWKIIVNRSRNTYFRGLKIITCVWIAIWLGKKKWQSAIPYTNTEHKFAVSWSIGFNYQHWPK